MSKHRSEQATPRHFAGGSAAATLIAAGFRLGRNPASAVLAAAPPVAVRADPARYR